MVERRGCANERLIRAKAALLRDAPELNAFRLLAVGNPLWGRSDLLRIEASADPTDSTKVLHRWILALEGQDRLRSVDAFDTDAAAAFAADEALALADWDAFYRVVGMGSGRQGYRLADGTDASARLLGESPQTYASKTGANTAMATTAAAFAALRRESSAPPLERRIAHLTGIRSPTRRRLLMPIDLMPIDAYFEIYEEAEESIRQVLRYGMDEWNYRVSTAGATTFNVELRGPAGRLLALPNRPWGSRQEAELRIAEIVGHLYRDYSAEGFHMVEHLALRPREKGDIFLSLPISGGGLERDPYSQRLSLVFPSGYARDFSVPPDDQKLIETTPHRFRDLEFRRYAERMVQQACPAHFLPTIYWVDRQAPGSPDNPASFDSFENRYFAWLDKVLIPGEPADTSHDVRNKLVESLNAIANGQ
jgi:hypothetical protein